MSYLPVVGQGQTSHLNVVTLVPDCRGRRRYAMKEVTKDSWAPDTMPSLYLFISRPPRNIPTAPTGRFNSPGKVILTRL